MPQESVFTPTPPPTNRVSHLEPSSKPGRIQAKIGSRNQEHAYDGQQCDRGLQTEQLVALGMAQEGTRTTVETARYDEDSDASFRRRVKLGRIEEPATSSMEAQSHNPQSQKPQSHSRYTDDTRTVEHTSTVTATTDGTSLSDIEERDEVIGVDLMDLPPQADILLRHILTPPTPPHIIERACSFAEESDVSVTEEELLTFERQPLEAKKHYLRIFFKELSSMELIL